MTIEEILSQHVKFDRRGKEYVGEIRLAKSVKVKEDK